MFETKSPLDVATEPCQHVSSATGSRSTGPSQAKSGAPSNGSFQPHPQNQKMSIPLYAPGGHFIRNLTASEAESMRGVTIRRNKRGHITGCYLKPLTCHVVRYGDKPGYGDEFEQELASGRIYALRGVVGSK